MMWSICTAWLSPPTRSWAKSILWPVYGSIASVPVSTVQPSSATVSPSRSRCRMSCLVEHPLRSTSTHPSPKSARRYGGIAADSSISSSADAIDCSCSWPDAGAVVGAIGAGAALGESLGAGCAVSRTCGSAVIAPAALHPLSSTAPMIAAAAPTCARADRARTSRGAGGMAISVRGRWRGGWITVEPLGGSRPLGLPVLAIVCTRGDQAGTSASASAVRTVAAEP